MYNSVTPWTIGHQAPLPFTISLSLFKFMSIESVISSNHLILCRTFLLLCSIFPTIRVFSNESALHIKWPKYWSFSFSISPSMNIQHWFPLGQIGLISFQTKGQESSPAPQFKSINISVFSLLYGPTLTSIHDYWKNHSFDIWTFVSQMMSLLFNTLSRFVIAFFSRTKRLLISWMQSLSTMILESKKIKSVTASTFPPLFAMKWWDWMPWF